MAIFTRDIRIYFPTIQGMQGYSCPTICTRDTKDIFGPNIQGIQGCFWVQLYREYRNIFSPTIQGIQEHMYSNYTEDTKIYLSNFTRNTRIYFVQLYKGYKDIFSRILPFLIPRIIQFYILFFVNENVR